VKNFDTDFDDSLDSNSNRLTTKLAYIPGGGLKSERTG